MAFVKLDCGILDSTLWVDREARELFITALLMAQPIELDEPREQIEIRTLNRTGFIVPPGWYGFVPAAGTGIVRRAGMDLEPGMAALERLGAPDSESRTPNHDGRRLVRVDGGFIVLNYMKHREKDHTAAERMRRYRDRQRVSKVTNSVTDTPSRVSNATLRVKSRHVTQAEAYKETHSLGEASPGNATEAKTRSEPVAGDEGWPSIGEVLSFAETNGIGKTCAEAWHGESEGRGRRDGRGQPITRWKPALAAYWTKWKKNERTVPLGGSMENHPDRMDADVLKGVKTMISQKKAGIHSMGAEDREKTKRKIEELEGRLARHNATYGNPVPE